MSPFLSFFLFQTLKGLNERRLTRRRLNQRRIRQRHPDILGLPSVDGVRGDRVSEQLALGAPTGLAADAVVALLTGRVEGHDNLVAHGELGHLVALLHDGAHELVTADEVRRAFQVAAVKVQVGALEIGELG